MSRLFTRIVHNNGAAFGVHLFGSLPTETTNWLPELVPEAVLKRPYFDWLEWAEQVEGSAWLSLEESLIAHELEPNPMARAFAAFRSLPSPSEPETLSEWLHERDQESANLPDRSRQLILDDYFRRRYDER